MKFLAFIFSRIALLALFFFSAVLGVIVAQAPQGIPQETEPVDLQSTSDVILYIVVPVLFIFAFIGLRYFRNKNKNQPLQ